MKINFSCPSCQKRYSVAPKLAGKKAKCKQCGEEIRVPSPPEDVTEASGGADMVKAVAVKQPKTAQPTLTEVPTVADTTPQNNAPQAFTDALEAQLNEVAPSVKQVAGAKVATGAEPVMAAITGSPAQGIKPAATVVGKQSIAPGRPVKPPQRTLSTGELISEIKGQIKPVPTSMSYRLTVAFVALVMVLLPLVYIGLICLVAFGLYRYATEGTAIFDSVGSGRTSRGQGFGILLLYVGPLVIGAVTVLFMIKPLFARPAKRASQRRIPRETEPRLFEFIDALCEAVHAPKPKRIEIDCDVNASASYGRGMLSVFMSNDLVLTIGMPLVAGLSARQLAGVLAHEFGHFSQGFGMRLSYLIRSISFWFARVVYERDRWDEWLANLSQSLDIRIGIVLYLARLAVWISRRILWVQMMIGNAVSCTLLRQMEYDADMHEIRFSGSETFEKTAAQLRRLGLAMQQSYADQQEFFVKGQLAQDMPELVRANRDLQDDDTVKKILSEVAHEKTHWLATHPADKDRIAQAHKANDKGVFHLEAPASVLFDHYDKLCAATTRDLFEQVVGKYDLKKAKIVPNEHILSHKQVAQDGRDALKKVFGAEFNLLRPIPIAFQKVESPDTVAREMKVSMESDVKEYTAASKQLDEVDSKWIKCGSLAFLLDLGIKLKEKDFEDVPVSSAAASRKKQESCRAQLQEISSRMESFEARFANRVSAAFIKVHRAAQRGDAESISLLQSGKRILQAYPAIQQILGDVTRLRNEFTQLAFFFAAVDASNVDERQISMLNDKGAAVYAAASRIRKHFKSAPYPLDHAEKDMTIARYLYEIMPEHQDDLGEMLNAGQGVLESYTRLYFSVVGELCRIVVLSDQNQE